MTVPKMLLSGLLSLSCRFGLSKFSPSIWPVKFTDVKWQVSSCQIFSLSILQTISSVRFQDRLLRVRPLQDRPILFSTSSTHTPLIFIPENVHQNEFRNEFIHQTESSSRTHQKPLHTRPMNSESILNFNPSPPSNSICILIVKANRKSWKGKLLV